MFRFELRRPSSKAMLAVFVAMAGSHRGVAQDPLKVMAPKLFAAIEKGDTVAARAALDTGESPDATTAKGASALVLAAATGHLEIVRLLLDRGARIDHGTPLGVTPLMAAVQQSQPACANLLIERGADLDAVNAAGTSVLMSAITTGQQDIALRLIAQGVDVDAATTGNGSTALILAAGKGQTKVMEALIAKGADALAVDAFGNTAAHYAKDDAARQILQRAEGREASPIDPEVAAALRSAFARWRQSLLAGDREGARLVAQPTIAQYETARDLALGANRAALAARPLIERFLALRLRLEYDAERLAAMSGLDLVAEGIVRGLIDKGTVADGEIGEIRRRGAEQAQSRLVVAGRRAGSWLHWRIEDGAWRIDLAQPARRLEAGIRQLLASQQGREDDRLVALLADVTGRKLDDSIWQPLRR